MSHLEYRSSPPPSVRRRLADPKRGLIGNRPELSKVLAATAEGAPTPVTGGIKAARGIGFIALRDCSGWMIRIWRQIPDKITFYTNYIEYDNYILIYCMYFNIIIKYITVNK
jgi:hypothetical protein